MTGLDRRPTSEGELSIGQRLFLFGIVVLLAGMFSESARRLRELLGYGLFGDTPLHGISNRREYRKVKNKIHGKRYVQKSADRRGERFGPVRKYVGGNPHPWGDDVEQGSWEFLPVAHRKPQREKSSRQGHHRRKNHANQDISQHWARFYQSRRLIGGYRKSTTKDNPCCGAWCFAS